MRCSDAARLRGDPLLGTAVPARRWLLVEQDGAWGPDALESLQLSEADHARVSAGLRAASARLMLIRRPGARPHDRTEPPRWCVVETEPPAAVVWGDLAGGVGELVAALADPRPRARVAAPIVLVCTHGRHDACCAIKGRPVAQALAERAPEEVWEASHTGGDRFAANLVLLPEGACYGSLTAESAPAVLDGHRRGDVDPAHLRGITGRTSQEQAALVAVWSELGALPWDRARLTTRRRASASGWEVEVSLDGDPAALVSGHDTIRPPELLTCSAEHASIMRVPVVDGVRRP